MAYSKIRGAACAAALLIAPLPAFAQPGLNQDPWSPPVHDQNSMAVVMAQMDGSLSNSGSTASSGQTLVCGGGGGTASATANSTCIIVNNSSGSVVSAGQDSNGNQTATSSTSTKTVTNTNTMSGALSALVPGS